jgi:hypothetical protein
MFREPSFPVFTGDRIVTDFGIKDSGSEPEQRDAGEHFRCLEGSFHTGITAGSIRLNNREFSKFTVIA